MTHTSLREINDDIPTDGLVDFPLLPSAERSQCGTGKGETDPAKARRDAAPRIRRKREVFRFTKTASDESLLSLNRRNQAPSINCSSIPDVVYTERGKTSAIVSWEPATAYDKEEGVLNVIQTEGQSSGIEHTEGEHVVTYMSRDRDGVAAFCSIHFTVEGSSCNANQHQWCSVRRCNHNYTYLDHGTAQCSPAVHPSIYGSACTYTCETGYQLVGPVQVACDDQGRWTGDKPVCEAVSCGPPANVNHGYLVCEYPLYTYPSTCQLICQPGYTNSGEDNSISCQSSGQWTTVQPCTMTSCPELDTPQNAELSCVNGNTYNSVCIVTCHENYAIEGESSSRCQANQTWSKGQLICKSTCPAPPSVSHGMYQCFSGHKYQDDCSLMCDSGYIPVGPITITCDINRQWSQLGSCLDAEVPTFPDGCPADIDKIAEEFDEPQIVSYTFPKVTDNSGEVVTVVGNPPSESEFSLGTTRVTVTAADSTGNQASCQFVVNLRALYCRDPNALVSENDPIVYRCPDGFIDGAFCDVSCSDGSSVTGPTFVKCSARYIFDARQWLWNGNTAPYCLDSCSPGQWSVSGNQPCELCSRGSYQSEYGQTSCDMCPYGMSTLISGATSENDCYFFDMEASPFIPLPVIQLYDFRPSSFSISLWAHLSRAETPKTALNFVLDPNKAKIGSAYFTLDEVAVYIFPSQDTTSSYIRYWYHIALVFDNGGERVGSITLFVNGEEIDTVGNLMPTQLNLKTIGISFVGNSFLLFVTNAVQISAFQMVGTALTPSEVRELTTVCKKALSSNVLAANQSLSSYTITPTKCDAVNDCIDQPCGDHGTCLDGPGNFTCLCDSGWTGKLCDIPPDYCVNHPCANGATCISLPEHSTYTCVCAKDYKGPRCDQAVVDGGWSNWASWSSCSVACGPGQRSRVRICDNPPPDSDGQDCIGDREEKQVCSGVSCSVDGGYGEWAEWSQCSVSCGGGVSTRRRACDNPIPTNGGKLCDTIHAVSSVLCNTVRCPECMTLTKRDNHEDLECSLSQDKSMQECHVTCPPGFSLVPDQTDNSFLCGRLTNYTWTHQTDRNPTALLPECADQRLPSETSVVLSYEYSNLTCNQPQLLTNLSMAIQTRFQQVSGCQQSDYCNQSVVVQTHCGNREDRILSASVTMTLSNSNQTFLASLSSMSEENRAAAYARASMLEDMLTQLTSDSSELLQVSVDTGQYRGQFVTAQLMVNCPGNQAYYGGFCVDCPAGSYSAGNGSCLLCEPGFYQNQAGMSSCLPCPQCWGTPGVGSYSVQHCSIDVCTKNTTSEATKDGEGSSEGFPLPYVVGIAGGVALCVTIVFVLATLVHRHRKKALKKAHPYDIPGLPGVKDENPYNTAGDDPYDHIDEDPYASAEGLVEDQVSDGYLKAIHVEYPPDSGLGIGDRGFSNDSYQLISGELQQSRAEGLAKDQVSDGYIKVIHVEYPPDSGLSLGHCGFGNDSCHLSSGELPQSRAISGNLGPQNRIYAKREVPPPGIFDDQVEVELREKSLGQDRKSNVPSYLELLNICDEKEKADQDAFGAEMDEETSLELKPPDKGVQADTQGKSDNTCEQQNQDRHETEEQPAHQLSTSDLTGSFCNAEIVKDELQLDVTDQPVTREVPSPHKPASVYRKAAGGQAIELDDGYITPI